MKAINFREFKYFLEIKNTYRNFGQVRLNRLVYLYDAFEQT